MADIGQGDLAHLPLVMFEIGLWFVGEVGDNHVFVEDSAAGGQDMDLADSVLV